MYLDFYGLTDQPFSITPNPRYVFLSKHHREVFAHLLYGIRRHAGFIEVTGEVGTGKTTVLRALFRELEREDARIAYIFNPCLSAPDLLRTVNREFGLEHQGPPSDLHAALNTFLLQENGGGRTVVLVIDEAQNLAVDVLEQVRLLSNLETETEKLIQIVLVGQPELGALLERQELRQLSQRITVRYHLQAMDADDTIAYIEHRLGIAGWNRGHLFTPAALRRIYQETQGNPRMINILCDRVLLIGYADNLAQLDMQEVRRAAAEIRRHHSAFKVSRPILVLLLLLPLIAFILWPLPRMQAVPVPERALPALRHPVDVSSEVLVDLRRNTVEENHHQAVNALLAVWGGAPVVAAGATIEETLDLSRAQNFAVALLQGEMEGLLHFRLPLLLEIADGTEIRYLLLLGAEEGGVRVALTGGKIVTMPPEHLAPYWTKRAYLLWKNPLKLPVRQGPLQGTREVVALQTLLNAAGKGVARSGRYDEATSAAVRAFQADQALHVDGVAGLQTLIALYREGRQYGYPLQKIGGDK